MISYHTVLDLQIYKDSIAVLYICYITFGKGCCSVRKYTKSRVDISNAFITYFLPVHMIHISNYITKHRWENKLNNI